MKTAFKLSNINNNNLCPRLVKDYLQGSKVTAEFVNHYPSLENFKKTYKNKFFEPSSRKLLYELLLRQARTYPSTTPQTLRNIDLIKEERTYCITTGHQPCIFLGPSYFINKIIHTIKLAHYLQKHYKEINIVPVCWLASEDHDFEEISSINIFNEQIKWEPKLTAGAVGRLRLDNIEATIQKIKNILYKEIAGNNIVERFLSCYNNNGMLAQATVEAINLLFGKYGLIVLDADTRELKASAQNIFKEDIFSQKNFPKIENTASKLKRMGYKVQLAAKPINIFYLTEKDRSYIEKHKDKFEVRNAGNLKFSEIELNDIFLQHPERFSPNAAIRPMYQEYCLPNLAYVGGPNEIAYWLELKEAFRSNNINFPLLIVRDSTLFLKSHHIEYINSLNLSIEDFLNNPNEIVSKTIKRQILLKHNLSKEKETIKDMFNALKRREEQLQVQTLLQASETNLLKQINKLENKLAKVRKQALDSSIKRLQVIKESILPGGALEERQQSSLKFILKYPILIDQLFEDFEPMGGTIHLYRTD